MAESQTHTSRSIAVRWLEGKVLPYLGTSAPNPSNPAPRLYSVGFYGGTADLPDTTFRIEYRCDPPPCPIWKPQSGASTCLTLLHSESGSGKSTFLDNFYRYIRFYGDNDRGLSFDFTPDLAAKPSLGIGFVPQNPAMVNHWPVAEIVPANSTFLPSFFDGKREKAPLDKRIGQFSGGQRRRLYACSALERLASRGDSACFILLDETFDGLGPEGLSDCVAAFRRTWEGRGLAPLHILLVTHLPLDRITGCADALRLSIRIDESTSDVLKVTVGVTL